MSLGCPKRVSADHPHLICVLDKKQDVPMRQVCVARVVVKDVSMCCVLAVVSICRVKSVV